MRIENDVHLIQDQVEIVKQVQQKKQLKGLGNMLPGDGHHLFEFNKITYRLTIVKAEANKNYVHQPEPSNVIQLPKEKNAKRFEAKKDCFYLFALNAKNAVKKVNKRFKVPCVIVITDE